MKRVLLALLFLVAAARLAHAEEFFLKDGDTVVFYGDSITAQRLYTSYVESWVIARWPGKDIRFVHSGWGGDTVRGGAGGKIDKRLERDVIAWKPTVVTIMLGMNDASYRAFDEKILASYVKGYEQIVATLKERLPAARLVLIEPSPFDDVTRKPTVPGGYNNVLLKYGEAVRALAKREGLACVDLNAPVVACLEKANAENPEVAQKIIQDRVHPMAAGHLVMAKALLEAWHAPATISDVTVDLEAAKVVSAENAEVAEVTSRSWLQTDGALPLPIDGKDPAIALAVRSSSLLDALEKHVVRVKGLPEGEYELRIDETRFGTFRHDALAKGVSLSLHATPMRQHALDALAATRRCADLADARWKQFVVAFEKDAADDKLAGAVSKTLEGIDGILGTLRERQRAAVKPRPHRFTLVAK